MPFSGRKNRFWVRTMRINEDMGHIVMRLCRAEDYGELHRLLIGRIAYKDGIDEGHSLLHDVADILKMAKDDFPKYPIMGKGEPWSHREYEKWFKKWFSQFIEKGEDENDI